MLTDGGIIYDNHTNEYKRFNVKDGMIIKHLQKRGFIVGAITGRDSKVVSYRCNELGLDFHYHGSKDKLVQYAQIKKKYGLEDEHICYTGDDVNDLPILSRCGLSACPADARPYMHEYAKLVTSTKGGEGVIRDVADFILQAQGTFQSIIDGYLD